MKLWLAGRIHSYVLRCLLTGVGRVGLHGKDCHLARYGNGRLDQGGLLDLELREDRK